MKKLAVAILVGCLVAGTVSATNEVTSVNAVGYVRVLVPGSNQYNMVSASLCDITGTNSLRLSEIFGTNQLTAASNKNYCDKVLVWDEVQQLYVTYVQKASDRQFYFYTNFFGSATNPIVPRGASLWITSPTSTSEAKRVTFMGGVPTDDEVAKHFTGSASSRPYYLIANPYPTSVNINDLISTNDGAHADSNKNNADWMILWDCDKQIYVTMSLKSNANETLNNKWFYYTNFFASSPPAVTLDPGMGVWYKPATNFDWIESKTYVWP